ncbi:MAG: phosphoenolpyruvate--protein phosphotransferase, partial [Candidatus Latescibacteria bacterium]|nr:phosphoenolpyruvate--protein phosphotransferase [Candidatus Latescibacterota bacterium]
MKADEEISGIFRSHRAVLEDPEIVDVTIVRIRRESRNAEYIFDDIMQGWIASMSAVENPFFRERTADFEDVRYRVLARLMGKDRKPLQDLDEPVVIIAHNLSPTDTAEIDRSHVCGFVTDVGGEASHTSIVARGLAVPAVVGTNIATTAIEEGALVIVDGTAGLLFVNPSQGTIDRFIEARSQLSAIEQELLQFLDVPATTEDGWTVELSANIELPLEVEAVLSHGADGIGLYRTEFLYLLRHGLPSEEEQYQAYKSIAEQMAPKSVILRTLDLGADKMPDRVPVEREANPALGFRGIRLCLEHPDIFKVQLRAILRASTVGNLRIMFPMISRLSEIQQARAVLDEVKADLTAEGIDFDDDMPVGIMIEVPSAALTAADLASEADFFSIGTNDLIQYTLAADRGNTGVASIYDAYHPAILRLIDMVVAAAHEHGVWVGVCGMMASDPWTACLLLGLGLDELSMSPIDIPEVKRPIRSMRRSDLSDLAQEVLSLSSSHEIHEYVKARLTQEDIHIP